MANKWISFSKNDLKELLAIIPEEHLLYKKISKAQKTIKIQSAKGKGRNLQQWVCRWISELLRIPYDQSDDQCLIHSREMGQSGTDVVLRGDASNRFPFAIECKSTETLQLFTTIRQAKINTIWPYKFWMIVHKSKRLRDPIAIMPIKGIEYLFNTNQWI